MWIERNNRHDTYEDSINIAKGLDFSTKEAWSKSAELLFKRMDISDTHLEQIKLIINRLNFVDWWKLKNESIKAIENFVLDCIKDEYIKLTEEAQRDLFEEVITEIETKNKKKWNKEIIRFWKKKNLLEELKQNWVPEKVIIELDNLIEKFILDMAFTDNKVIISREMYLKEKDNIYNNFLQLILTFIHVESDWINQSNKKWSWAEWFLQYKTNNWWSKWENIDEERKNFQFNSFDTALRRAYHFQAWEKPTTSLKLKNNPNVDKWIIEAYNKKKNPKELTWDEQILLYLYDTFMNTWEYTNEKWNKIWTSELFAKALLWDKESMKILYTIFHHTNTKDKSTQERYEKISKEYTPNLIALK